MASSSSNRTQVASVKETTVGTTPGTPRMRLRRTSGEGLKWVPTFVDSQEIRSDGMNPPPIKTGEDSNGDLKFELSFPFQDSPADVDIQSAMRNTWTNTNSRDNDGTADSVVTDVATTNTVLTVTTGTAFVAGEVYKFSGFGVTGNNGNFKCTTGSATVPRFVGSGITNEAAPPAAARVKMIGIEGAAGDITATSTGLASSSIDFTTIAALAVGRWIKIDSTTPGYGFATSALNTFMRITAVAAHAITLDNRPSGWTTDAGSGKTIRVYVGDQIINGTTQIGQSFEKGFMGLATPVYIVQPGMVVTEYPMTWTAKQVITGDVKYIGMTGASQSTTSLDASPDATTSLTSYPVMACSAHIGRIGENGSALGSPNFVKELTFTLTSTVTPVESINTVGPAALTTHSCSVTGTVKTLFGDNTLLTKLFAGTLSSINAIAAKSNMAFIVTLPAITYNGDGSPNASAMNQDVDLSLPFKASKEETYTNAMILFDRMEYYA